MKIMKFVPALLLVLSVLSCSGSSQRRQKSEAAAEALRAARAVLAVDTVVPVDSFALERAILEAKALQARYDTAQNQEASRIFDRVFSEVIMREAPGLAHALGIEDAAADDEQ
ncbi:MAG: hypothetical protein ACI308_01760 [Muribaculaceae bacterium]